MADQQHYQASHGQQEPQKSKGLSSSHLVALLTLLPFGGTLLLLAGLTLSLTVIGIALSTPLFVIFSPVLVPAAFIFGLWILGLLTSGAFGITAVVLISRMVNYVRKMGEPEQGKYALGRKTKEVEPLGALRGEATYKDVVLHA